MIAYTPDLSGVDEIVITLALAAFMGAAVGWGIVWVMTRQQRRAASDNAEHMVLLARQQAEVEAKHLIQQTDNELAIRRAEVNRELDRREIEVELRLREIRSHEESLSLLDHQLQARQERLNREGVAIKQGRDAVRNLSRSVRQRLEQMARMDAGEIRQALRDEVLLECQDELRAMRRQTLERSEQELANEGRRILLTVMQRLTSRPLYDVAATLVHLPGDEMKGRIIGREGRNIKAFESATGVTLLIDDSPQTVLVSSFDPVRREVARIALEALVKDGRIHPASIEEHVNKAREETELHVMQAGEDAVQRLNVTGIHPEIIRALGRLKFRFAHSQNVLDHSIEVGQICSMLASEMGLDPQLAKRAGLLHDLGKAIEGEYEGSHALIGAEFVKRHGETPVVVNAIAAHHEEAPPETVYAGIVILADALSAARPGARAESMAAYAQRLDRLEKLALEYPGVQMAYAIQAGREIRVLAHPEKINDDQCRELATLLRRRIENELQYPSTIKITVIRETRFTETAT